MVELAACKGRAQYARQNVKAISAHYREEASDSIVNSNAKPKARRPTLKSKDTSSGSRILVIPDTQVKPGVNTDHLEWAGHYAVKMKPDVIVHIGDHWDMPSLSSYDKKGSRQMEGKRYVKDIDAGNAAMDRFMEPIHHEIGRLKRGKRRAWNPRLVYTMGNHENRINRAVDADAQLEDLISTDDFNLADHGFEVVPFLSPSSSMASCSVTTSAVASWAARSVARASA